MGKRIDSSRRVVKWRLTQVGNSFRAVCRSGVKRVFAVFVCECGSREILNVSEVMAGGTKSCGCWRVDECRKKRLTHGATMGGARTPEHAVWVSMIQRCRDRNQKSWSRYGGRGITVCERWQKFENFLEDMGHKPCGLTLDRIDNSRGYEPGNCRWATPQEQARNKRNTVWITANGKTQSLADWADELGVSYSLLAARHKRNWSHERIVNEPKRAQ